MFTRAAAGQKNSSGAGGSGKGLRLRALGQPRARAPGDFRRAAGGGARRGDRHAGRGPDPRAVTIAGNPLVSTPNAERLTRAVEWLDFMLAVDIYVNETTRHADVVLPGPEPLEKSHYDLALYQLAVRNVANFSPPVFQATRAARVAHVPPARRDRSGQGPDADVDALDAMVIADARSARAGRSGVARRRPRRRRAHRGARATPRARADPRPDAPRGPYGDAFGEDPDGPDARRAREQPARHRPRPARAAAAGGAAHAVRQGRAGAEPIVADVAAAARRARARAERRDGADRPPPAALEQLVDAQPAPARQGQGPLHAARPPGRRGAARARATAAARWSAPARARSRRRSR